MLCKNCNGLIEANELFCKHCGEKNEQTHMATVDLSSTPKTKAILINEQENTDKKKIFSKQMLIAIAVCIFVALGSWFHFNTISGTKQKNNIDFIVYFKDKNLSYIDLGISQKKPISITENFFASNSSISTQEINQGISSFKNKLEKILIVSPDKKLIFYPNKLDNTVSTYGFPLYYKNLGSDKKEDKKIDSEVSKFSVFFDGANTKIFYLKGSDMDFYQNDFKENRSKIATNVKAFWISNDGKNIVYNTKDKDLYLVNEKGEKDKLDSLSEVKYISKDFKNIYYLKENSLYHKKQGQEKIRISNDVFRIAQVFDTGEIYFIKSDENIQKLSNFVCDDLTDNDQNIRQPVEPSRPYPYQFTHWAAYYNAVDIYNTTYNRYIEDYVAYVQKSARDKLRIELSNKEYKTIEKKLCYYDGKQVNTVADNLYQIINIGSKPVALFSQRDTSNSSNDKIKLSAISYSSDVVSKLDKESYSTNKKDKILFVIKDKSFEIEHSNGTKFKINPSANKILFIDNYNKDTHLGDLCEIAIENNTLGKIVKVDSDVYEYTFASGKQNTDSSIKNDSIFYIKNLSTDRLKGDLYMDKLLIDSDVSMHVQIRKIGDSKNIVYYTDYDQNKKEYGTLKIHDGKSAKKIAEEVHQFYIIDKNKIVYLDKFNSNRKKGDLFLYDGSEQRKQLDLDVSTLFCFYFACLASSTS